MNHELILFVNGQKVVEKNANARHTVVQYLRDKLQLTGTKESCGIGGCGACTVMLSKYDHINSKIRHFAVNGCLIPLFSIHGHAITTVEGIGNTRTKLHAVQEKLVEAHGIQCGFCTPGMVMSMYALLRNDPNASMKQIENAIKGNICRCTGYRPILEGFRHFAKEKCGIGDQCCKNRSRNKTQDIATTSPFDPTQEPIFPSELQLSKDVYTKDRTFGTEELTWHRPTTLDSLLNLKKQNPEAVIALGCTYLGFRLRSGDTTIKTVISASGVADLSRIEWSDNYVTMGAGVTIAELESALQQAITKHPEEKARGFEAILNIVQWFACMQIKNTATIGGHICHAEALSDLNPLFVANKCGITAISLNGTQRDVVMNESFFPSVGKCGLKPDEVLLSMKLPFSDENTYFGGYKESGRQNMSAATLTAALRVQFQPNSSVVVDACFVFSGQSVGRILTAVKCSEALKGRKWSSHLLHQVIPIMEEEVFTGYKQQCEEDSVLYRKSLASGVIFRFFFLVASRLIEKGMACEGLCPQMDDIAPLVRQPSHGIQVYDPAPHGDTVDLGKPIPLKSAKQQATGEAMYFDDIPCVEGELHLALITSTVPHARILSVDTAEALTMPGVVDYISHTDVPGSNVTGSYLIEDEEVFASKEVNHIGAIIGGILAKDPHQAKKAAQSVKVHYDVLPYITTIQEAIASKSFVESYNHKILFGSPEQGFKEAEQVLEGHVSVGAQLHFSMETNICLVYPKEEDEMDMWIGAHDTTFVQSVASKAIGVQKHKLNLKLKRMGGSFGSKWISSRKIILPTAIAAYKHRKPVRCKLLRKEDSTIMGGKDPMLASYKVGFLSTGKILALEMDVYCNSGSSTDVTPDVLDIALMRGDGAYYIPNLLKRGHLCKTNICSPTAFRGFGILQSTFITETVLQNIAKYLKKPATEVQYANFYKDGNLTPWRQPVTDCVYLERCWQEVMEKADVSKRQAQIQEFNKKHNFKKKGMSIVPIKFGGGVPVKFLNQGSALVNVYTDGSVLIHHGGVEMGQGLDTKIIQVAGIVLGIPMDKIHIADTNTTVVPNTVSTNASRGSDIYAQAVLDACKKILERIETYKAANPSGQWEDWVMAAYVDRTSLSATGFSRLPGVSDNYNWENPAERNQLVPYFTYGVACSEVEVDVLNGTHIVQRVDIVMDVGKSLNPAIDIGQIEGGFVQGMGGYTTEEVQWNQDGCLVTTNFDTYKVPTVTDIPCQFNVTLLKESSNPQAVYSSKGIGEPPLLGSCSVLFAIQEALYSALRDAGLPDDPFILDAPITAEKIKLFCVQRGITKF